MAYRLLVAPRAQDEIENAIDYYAEHSTEAPLNFIRSLSETYRILEKSPLVRTTTGQVQKRKIKKFPYLLFYVIDDQEKVIKILACFHERRNPNNKPKLR